VTLFAGVDVSFPLTIEFADGERLAVKSIGEAETQLEWFDSTDPDEEVSRVVDARGRPVDLVVEGLTVKVLKLR